MLLDLIFIAGIAYGSFWMGGKCEGKFSNLGKRISDLFHKLEGKLP